MLRTFTSILLVFSVGIFISCSGSANVAQQSDNSEQMDLQQYPSWYGNNAVVSTDSLLYGYATAIDYDSASAVEKARAWAQSELKSAVSNKLETIRSEAVLEYGSEAGLDSSRFLLALRKADNAVSYLIENGQSKVQTVEGYDTYRSFAEVVVPKEALIERIGKRLGGYENAWNAMKESKAFQDF